MADLREIFANIGIGPINPSISEFGRTNPMANATVNRFAAERQAALEAAAGPMAGYEVSNAYTAPGSVGDIQNRMREADEDSYGWGDFFNDALEVVDTARAFVVSGAKEINDFGLNLIKEQGPDWLKEGMVRGGFDLNKERNVSWDEFVDQGWRNIGFREVVDDATPNAPGWLKTTAGLVGDIALDPLTYVPVLGATKAAKTVAVTAADKALLQAVEQGGRNTILKAVTEKAVEAGLQNDQAIGRLIKNVGQRGRGGLTRKALAEAGLDAAKIEAMNIPTLERALVGMRIPRSRVFAEVAEATKGNFKKVLGETAAAEWYRGLRVSDMNGVRSMVGVLRGKEQDLGKIWTAAKVLGLDDDARVVSRGWGVRTAERLVNDVKETIGKVSDDAASDLTRAVENGVVVPGTEAFTNVYKTVSDEMVARGLMAPEQVIQNYVPRYMTQEARVVARGNSALAKEVKRIIESVSDNAGFLSERTLVADGKTTFLGEVLQRGTIEEINEIAARNGFKMFEDDIRSITTRYIAQAQAEISRDVIRKGLIDAGIATDKQMVRSLSDDELQVLADAKMKAKSTRQQINALRGKSFATRKTALLEGEKVLKKAQKSLLKQQEDITKAITKIGTDRTKLVDAVAVLDKEIASHQATIDVLTKQLDRFDFNTEAKLAAQVDLKKASERMLEAQAKYRVARDELESFLQKHTALARPSAKRTAATGRLNSAKNQAALVEGLPIREMNLREAAEAGDKIRKRIADIEEDIGLYEYELQDLVPARAKIVKSFEKPEKALQKVVDLKNKNITEIADLDALALSRTEMLDTVNALQKRLDDPNRVTGFKGKVSDETIAELKQRGEELKDLFNNIGDSMRSYPSGSYPMVDAADYMAKQEMIAWIYDTKAAFLGRRQASLEDMINTMRDPNFGSVIRYHMNNGMASLTESKQIPQWLDDALESQIKIQDPEFTSKFIKFIDGFSQRWKQWALARPGAVSRNAMGSSMAVYLDRGVGAVDSINDFRRFHSMFKKNPDTYLDEAATIWSPQEVQNLDRAMSVMNASGGGQSLVETERALLTPGNLNVFSKDFKPLHWSGSINEEIESVLRGGHAYDVLKAGGSDGTALAAIEKWHFNYRDLTDFDRRMKRVIPFWTFFNKNTALQANVWTHNLRRLNKYMTVKRNMENGKSDSGVPDYITRAMGIGVNINPEGKSMYADVALPSFDFIKNIQTYQDDPLAFLSNLNPLLKVPVQGVSDRNFSTGGDFSGYRDAGFYGQTLGRVPGLGGLFPETGSGGRAATPFTLSVLNDLLPGLANASRLSGETPKGFIPPWISFITGVSLTEVTPKMREYALRDALREESAAEYKKKLLEGM